LRADISAGRQLRDRPVGPAMAAATVVWLAIAIAAPNLAARNAPRRASTSLYKLSLTISSKRLLGNGAENPIAVDRHGNTYTFKATRTQQGFDPLR
jgi:hemin uptake protein HemP